MWRKVLIILAIVLIAGAGLAWLNRKAIILYLVATRAKDEVGPHQPITWAAGPAAPDQPLAERPPNIIFILADDLGINDISTFGGGVAGGRVPTPNIDRLAASGAIFRTAYSGTATCAPSRAMLMTGRYPTRTGFEFTPTPDGMGRIVKLFEDRSDPRRPRIELDRAATETRLPFLEQGLPPEEITLPEILSAHGYHTVHIGKWHLGYGDSRPRAQGFAESLDMASGLHLPEDHPDTVNAYLPFDPIDTFLWARMQYAARFNDGPLMEPGGYLADWWTDESLKVIDANANRPFFLYLAHWGVHTPLQATREDYDAVGDIEPHRLRVYAAMVRSIDRSVGRILDKLDEAGLAENTIIVFSSDNGGAGYLGLPEINAPFRGWKISLFEGGIRVPMFVRWPGRIPEGTVIDTPVAHVDVMPTLVRAAGAALPEGVPIDGQDILPEATGEGRIERLDDAIFWSSGYYKVVRAGGWKLQVHERQQQTWLFNLNDDPTEQVNLAEAEPAKRAELEALIAAHWSGARPPLYPSTANLPVLIDKTLADPYEPGDEYIYWPN
ncbi:sulfatase-like hydrolase/transferase [Hyphomonas sp.]|uniref:sulfatase-like hydrolase/transferase n=1 Tax=Hyphomonas sp. TaxID=87 RepID=UPI00391CC1DE